MSLPRVESRGEGRASPEDASSPREQDESAQTGSMSKRMSPRAGLFTEERRGGRREVRRVDERWAPVGGVDNNRFSVISYLDVVDEWIELPVTQQHFHGVRTLDAPEDDTLHLDGIARWRGLLGHRGTPRGRLPRRRGRFGRGR